jgi:hypothetical protein
VVTEAQMRGGREEVIIPPGAAAGALYSAPSLLFGFGFVFSFSRRRLREAAALSGGHVAPS